MDGRSYAGADEPDLCDLWLQLNADDEQQQPAAPNAAAVDAPAPAPPHHHDAPPPPALQPQLQQPQQEEEELPPPEPEPDPMGFEQADIEDFLGGIFNFWDDGGEEQDLPAVVVPGAGNMVEPPAPPPPAPPAHPIIFHVHAAAPDMEEMRRFILDAGEDACKKLPKPIRQFCYNRPPYNKFLAVIGKQNGKIKRLANVAKHAVFVTAQMRRLMEEYLGQKAEIIAHLEDGMNKEKCKNNFPASGRRNNGDDGPSGGGAGAGAAAMA